MEIFRIFQKIEFWIFQKIEFWIFEKFWNQIMRGSPILSMSSSMTIPPSTFLSVPKAPQKDLKRISKTPKRTIEFFQDQETPTAIHKFWPHLTIATKAWTLPIFAYSVSSGRQRQTVTDSRKKWKCLGLVWHLLPLDF